MWFTSSSGRIELEMTLERAESASHQGPCDEDVLALKEKNVKLEKRVIAGDPSNEAHWGFSVDNGFVGFATFGDFSSYKIAKGSLKEYLEGNTDFIAVPLSSMGPILEEEEL